MAPRGIPHQALQLIAPMGWDLGISVQGKALHAGTAGTGERGHLAVHAKTCAHAPHPLASLLAKSKALLHRGSHGTGQLRRVITPGA
jgi:hypothetical protein